MITNIKFNAIDFPVTYSKELRSETDLKCYGLSNFGEKYIKLLEDLPIETQLVTLLHEFVHMLYNRAGIVEIDEKDCDIIAYAFYELLVNNPDLLVEFAKISEGEKDESDRLE